MKKQRGIVLAWWGTVFIEGIVVVGQWNTVMEQWDIVIEQVPIVRGTMAHWGIVMGQLTVIKHETR